MSKTTYDYLDKIEPNDEDILGSSVNNFTDPGWNDYGYPNPLDTLPIFIRSGIKEVIDREYEEDY